ncbi:MAG TPA: ABC transporter permease [Gemmatimonadaceae bacterium]|nr:ABC transporter permease [Gemmatimonadaceae bacterium]
MLRFLVRRTFEALLVVWLAVSIAFVLMRAAPGEPFAHLLEDPRAGEDVRRALIARYGLDQPLAEQYRRFLAGAARGDFGVSLSHARPVRAVIVESLPNTVLLASVALLLGFAFGIALGALQGAREGSLFDRASSAFALVLAALPEFWLGTVALLLFAVHWPLFPAAGMTDPVFYPSFDRWGKLLDVLRHLALPSLTLALVVGAAISRYQRAALLEVLPEAFMRTARAKGLPRRRAVYRHALRPALLPVITLGGLAVPAIVGGAVFVEQIYAWPGLGRVAVEAVQTRDYPLVLGCVIVTSVLVSVGSLLADILQRLADPRLRHA